MYEEAADQIAKNISITDGKIEVMLQEWDSLSDDDKSVYRSKIYQKNFQKQLQSQINGILKDLNSGQYKSIDEYLKKCYETGYIGTMYDIAGQGIPIITPIDQKKVITAMKTNSKISSGLYTKLGEDVQHLQKRIANNISRGIATSDSYENIARNISNASNVGLNNAMRIARTEGHRIHSNSAHDAQLAAKDAGADIVKQWDSTMDGKTRTTHRLLDGQIREVEEPFEMGGMKAMYPSDFGRPEEDINCRCALLQRATWALDDDELETLKEKAKFHEIYVEDDDKETFRKQKDIDFNAFKKRYLNAAAEPKVPTVKPIPKVTKPIPEKTVVKTTAETTEVTKITDDNLTTLRARLKVLDDEMEKTLDFNRMILIQQEQEEIAKRIVEITKAQTAAKKKQAVLDIQEAVKSNNLFGRVELKDCDVDSAQAILSATNKVHSAYPDVALKSLVLTDDGMKGTVEKTADALGKTFGANIRLNGAYFKDAASLLETTKRLYSTDWYSCDSIEGIVAHELGHALCDYYDVKQLDIGRTVMIEMGLDPKKAYIGKDKKLYDEVMHISRYGEESLDEWFSECFASVMTMENPPEIAKKAVEVFNRMIKGKKQ